MALLLVVAMTGVAVDMGRMYIAKNEAQAYVDSAALTAVLELDGTTQGFTRARNTVSANLNRWNLGSSTFNSTQTEFGITSTGPWEANPVVGNGYRFIRVGTGVNVPLNFMTSVTTHTTSHVRAQAVAGQDLRFNLDEGLCPFSPFAHDAASPPHFGLSPNVQHTLRWPNPGGLKIDDLCQGDQTQAMLDLVKSGQTADRGYIEDTSSSVIRQAIVYDYQTWHRAIGDSVVMTGGSKQTQQDALIERVGQDSDPNAPNYNAYLAGGNGNGRRMIACPINTGAPDYTIVQFSLFYLDRAEVYAQAQGGNKSFCAEYIGPYVQGSDGPGAGDSGYYVGRLYQ